MTRYSALEIGRRAEIERIDAERAALCRRIMLLPRRSHRRLALEARAAELARRELTLEAELRRAG